MTTYKFEDVSIIMRELQNRQGPLMAQMRNVLDHYNGEYIIPLPDVKDEPNLPPLTPALIGDIVDDTARRAASTRPIITCPALEPKIERGARSAEYGQIRRRILSATYYESRWRLGRRRMYRHLSAYSTFSLAVIPDFDKEMPRLEVRDPMGTFSEPMAAEALRPPEYVGFITRFSGARLRRMFPETMEENGGPIAKYQTNDMMWDVVEWMDCEQTLYGLLGPSIQTQYADPNVSDSWRHNPSMQLGPSYPNKSGCCPAIVPVNLSLGGIMSRLASMLGNIDLQAKLMALNIIAQEKAIFPDTYAIGRQGMMPQIVGGKWKDGREGGINLLMDVDSVGVLRNPPDQGTNILVDRLERNMRVSNGLVPQAGGETYGALRTGRGIDALSSIALDPRIQELHEIEEEWIPLINESIFACYKGWWGRKSYSMHSGYPGDMGLVEFIPNVHIEIMDNIVSYTAPGADIIQQTQILGSMLGTKSISLKTFRAKHPWIENPDAEGDLVAQEEMEEALRMSIMQQLTSGQLPMVLASKIHAHLKDGEDIFAAVEKADEELRRMQAAQPPPVPEGMAAAPEAMPGIAAGPGAAMAPGQPPPAIAPNSDVEGMRALMNSMSPRALARAE